MIYLSDGNMKLKKTESVDFLVWNIPAIATCPYSTPQCRKSCYARKSERLYPSVLPCRKSNFDASQTDSFISDMIAAIEKKLIRSEKKGKSILFRIHESGDFYSMDYLNKWYSIADYFLGRDIVFQAYTKSVDYIQYDYNRHNIHFTYSIWDDTSPSDRIRALSLGLQTYSAVLKFTDDIPETKRCHCIDCGACQKCYNNNINSIVVEVH